MSVFWAPLRLYTRLNISPPHVASYPPTGGIVKVLSASFHSISVGVVELNRAQGSPPPTSQSMFQLSDKFDFQTRDGNAHGGEPSTNLIGPGSVFVHDRR